MRTLRAIILGLLIATFWQTRAIRKAQMARTGPKSVNEEVNHLIPVFPFQGSAGRQSSSDPQNGRAAGV